MKKFTFSILMILLATFVVVNITCKKDDDNDNPPDPEPPVYTDGQGEVGEIGGTVKIEDSGSPLDGASVEVPEEALDENVSISITEPTGDIQLPGVENPTFVQFLPEGQTFSKAVTLSLPFTGEANTPYYYDETTGILEKLDVLSINQNSKILKTETTHFSLFFSEDELFVVDLELVKSNGQFAATGKLIIGLEYTPTHPFITEYENAYQVAENEPNNCVARFEFSLYKKLGFGLREELATKVYFIHWHEFTETIRVAQSYNTTHEDAPGMVEIFNKDVESMEERLNTWMAGKSTVMIFDEDSFFESDFEYDDDDEYFVGFNWGLNKPWNPVFAVDRWTLGYSFGSRSEAKKWNDLDEFTGDGNNNGIIDSYEGGGGGNQPPIDPHSPAPDHEATNVSINTTLSWVCSDPDGDDLDYDIYFGTSSNPPLAEEYYTSTSWNPGTLDENTTYYWYIKAFEVGNDDHYSQSELWEFTTGGGSGQTPIPPDNVYAGDWYDSPGVYWDDNSSNESGFKVYRAVNQINTGYSLLGEVNVDETHLADNDISGNNFYCYMVQTYNEYGQSAPSEYAVVPKTPTSMQGQANENDILIYWTNPNNSQANRFYIERKAGASADWEAITWISASETSYQDNNVQPGTQYYYRVHSAWTENNSDFASKSFPSEEIGPYEISGGGGNGQPCPGLETITYGGQVYNTVLIGDQCWLAENLNYEAGNSWCYDNDPSNCNTYGRLYDWETALTVCPSGWHLPGDEEWKILEGTVDSQYPVGDPEWDDTGYRGFDAGLNLKSTSGWNSNGNGTDLYGFGALPGGYRRSYGSFSYLGTSGYWWSSSESSGSYAWGRYLYYASDGSYRGYYYKTNGFSVRCLKDN